MRILAVIDDPAVIRNILTHRRRWEPKPKPPDHPARTRPQSGAARVIMTVRR